MSVIAAYMVPHPPMIVPAVGRGSERQIEATRAAYVRAAEEIAALDAALPAERLKLIATDGATNYLRPMIDAMDAETFEKWMEFHLCTCERQDLIGASHHTLDILRKE